MFVKAIKQAPFVTMEIDGRFSADSSQASVRDFISLLKPGVMVLVVYSGLVGAIAAPTHIHPFLFILTILCIALGSGAAAAFNMWYDRDIDLIMSRTKRRPIPAGKIAPSDALGYSIVLSSFSIVLLGLATNWFAAALLAFSIFFYDVIYTMLLKRRTPQNIVIGGAAGAFPPLIGWAAMTGSLNVEPLLLFLIIFLWTPSHFWALALFRSQEYHKANIPMLPVVRGTQATIKQILIYTYLLIGCTLLPGIMHWRGWFYSLSSLVLGCIYLYYAWMLSRNPTSEQAMRLFKYSIIYLFVLLTSFLIDHYFIL